MASIFAIFVLLLGLFSPCFGIFSWLFGSGDASESGPVVTKSRRDMALQTLKEVEKSLVNFDFGTDLKYLSDKTKHELEVLSNVDSCHQSLVLKLRKSCGRLNEDEVGKFAVQLLNCQLENEGRETYPCTETMSLKECTQEMTATVWNSYQIVGNRARSVCQSTKHHQFQIKTEMAVNQLMHSTVGQLRAMDQIREGQEKLGAATSETIRKMYEGQEDLMSRQESLKSSHSEVQEFVADNLKALTREKALIASGNQELAKMTESIRVKLDQATAQLEEQRHDRAQNHKEVVHDLALIRNKAKDVWDKIEANTHHLMLYHDQTTEQYDNTMANLKRLNDTVSYILSSVQRLKRGLDARFGWLQTLLTGSQEQITIIYIIVLHAGYFILAAILASFLQTELFTRTVILVIVPLNCVAAVKHGMALDFLALSSFVLLIIGIHWLVHIIHALISSTPPVMPAPASPPKPIIPPNCHPTPMVPVKVRDGLSKGDLAKIATALRDVLEERTPRRRHSSSTPLNISCDSALDSSFINDEPATALVDQTPIPDQEATFNPPDDNDDITERLRQVRAKLLNNVELEPVRKCRSLPQSPQKPSKRDSFMSLGVMTPSRAQCSAVTKAGKRCKKYCAVGQDVCPVHRDMDFTDITSSSVTLSSNSTIVVNNRDDS